MASKTQKRIQAAALLGQGRTRRSVAAELEIDPATISRWRRDESFRKLEQRARNQTLDGEPTVRATLEAALTAVKRTGEPDWPTRVQAARTLLGAPPQEPDPNEPVIIERRIYIDRSTGEELAA